MSRAGLRARGALSMHFTEQGRRWCPPRTHARRHAPPCRPRFARVAASTSEWMAPCARASLLPGVYPASPLVNPPF